MTSELQLSQQGSWKAVAQRNGTINNIHNKEDYQLSSLVVAEGSASTKSCFVNAVPPSYIDSSSIGSNN